MKDCYKKGGRVRRTGLALVHKGEFVVPAKKPSRTKARKETPAHKHNVIKL